MDEGVIQTGPMEIWNSMGIVGQLVLVFLLLMSVCSIAVMVDRFLEYRRARAQSRAFIGKAQDSLKERDLDGVLAIAKQHLRSHVARIWSAAIEDFHDCEQEGAAGFEETMKRAIEREALRSNRTFRRGLPMLASIGATAPFVGLFGTVVGIMNAFFGMAKAGQGGIGAVAGGIAEALVNTAVGLFVALPAVWAFNYFVGKVDGFNADMRNTGSEIADYFVRYPGR